MKKLSAVCSLAVGVAALALSGVSAQAGPGPYFTVDAGLNILSDFDVGGGSHLEFDPGVRFDAGVGYTVHQDQNIAISAGVEAGFIYNSIDKGVDEGVAGSVNVEGDLWQLPMIAKVTLKFMPESAWVPFITVGGGVVYSSIELTEIGGTPVFSSGDEWDPAVQAGGGVKYKLNDNSGVALMYKALFIFPGEGFDQVLNHSFMAAFTMSF
jgi:opacity protein-like surface antigen